MGVTPDDPGRRLGVRRAGPVDAEAVGRLLDAFNREFNEPTPGPAAPTLYARLGFTNREDGTDGPVMYVYERDL